MSDPSETLSGNSMGDTVLILVGGITWLAGIVLASGFWLTVLAIVCPFYAWYLIVARGLQALGWTP